MRRNIWLLVFYAGMGNSEPKEGDSVSPWHRQGKVVAKDSKLLVVHPALLLDCKFREKGSCRLHVTRNIARLLPPGSPPPGSLHTCAVVTYPVWWVLGQCHERFTAGTILHCCIDYMQEFMLLFLMKRDFTGTATECRYLNSTCGSLMFCSLLVSYIGAVLFLPVK